MVKIQEGDRVKLTALGFERFPHYGKETIRIVESNFGSLAVFNDIKSGWISESMGLHECFKLASQIRIGGE